VPVDHGHVGDAGRLGVAGGAGGVHRRVPAGVGADRAARFGELPGELPAVHPRAAHGVHAVERGEPDRLLPDLPGAGRRARALRPRRPLRAVERRRPGLLRDRRARPDPVHGAGALHRPDRTGARRRRHLLDRRPRRHRRGLLPVGQAHRGRARGDDLPGGDGRAAMTFDRMWTDLQPVGRDPRSGGYRRFAWTAEDAALREWFTGEAAVRGLDLTTDRAGNLWAWWGNPDADGPGLVVGSHLDSVPDGGAFDGPLGVVSALAALDALRERGWAPRRPLGIAVFADEEGARFGVACAGSRIITGALAADRARGRTAADGPPVAEAMAKAGHDPTHVGPDPEALRRVGAFVELHVEQGRALVDAPGDAAVGVASAIWPHGRWRLDLRGRADHAGTTRLADRDDPMLHLA